MCSTVKNELDLFFQILKNNMLDSSAPTRSAFTQARRKIRHGAFIALNSILVKCFYDLKIYKTWNDLRLIGVDGSQFQMPASEACGIYFGKNRKDGDQRSYVMSRGISFYDVLNGFILKSEIAPYSASERELAEKYIPHFETNDLFILDRGFMSFTIFRKTIEQNSKFCMRIPLTSIWAKEFVKSGKKENSIKYKANKKHKKLCEDLGLPITPIDLRLIRVELDNGDVEVLATNLYDSAAYPCEVFKKLYQLRWPIEEKYKDVKSKVQVQNWTGMSVETCKQDFYAKILTLNITALIIFQAQNEVKENAEHKKYDYKTCISEAVRKMRFRIIGLFTSNNSEKIILYLYDQFVKLTSVIRPERSFNRIKSKRRVKHSIRYKGIS